MAALAVEPAGRLARLCAGRRPLFGILALALLARMIAAAVLPDQGVLLGDAIDYRTAAGQLLTTGMFDNPYMMPLYPALIALSGGGLPQLGIDILLSVTTVWLVHALALALFGDRIIALVAALWTACYPPLIFFSVVGLSETLFITLLLATFVCWYREAMLAASCCAVLAILTRPVFDLAGIMLTVFVGWILLRRPAGRVARDVAVYGLIYVALMTPWWLHNYQRYGSFVRLTPGFGTTLYAGNNPMNRTGGGNLNEDYQLGDFAHIADPVARDRALRDSAISFMLDNPGRVIELAGMKFLRLWRLWPRNEGYTGGLYILGSVLSFGPVLLLAATYGFGWGWRERVRIAPIVLFIGYYVAVHMLLVGTIRYRLPLEPFLIIFAAAATVRLLAAGRRALMKDAASNGN